MVAKIQTFPMKITEHSERILKWWGRGRGTGEQEAMDFAFLSPGGHGHSAEQFLRCYHGPPELSRW